MTLAQHFLTQEQSDFSPTAKLLGLIGISLITHSKELTFEEFLSTLPPEMREHFKTPDDQVVCIAEDLKTLLTEEEMAACIKHEEGHFVLDHLSRREMGSDPVLLNEAVEIEADAYAMQFVSAKTLYTAINKVVGYCINETVKTMIELGMPDEYIAEYKSIMLTKADPIMQRRFETIKDQL